jgi:hypothetical protein
MTNANHLTAYNKAKAQAQIVMSEASKNVT